VQQKAAKDGRANPAIDLDQCTKNHSTKKLLESTGMKRLTTVVVLTLVPFAAAAQSTGVLATTFYAWPMNFDPNQCQHTYKT
jgi:hypothetical protein